MSQAIVMLVDDEKTVLDALRGQIRALFGSTLSCETAEGVDEAWEVLGELIDEEGETVILIVSDWLMPGTKGDEFLEGIRARYPGIVRVMLTGQADEAAIRRVQEGGLAQLLLYKPWRQDDLVEAIKLALAS